MASETDWKELVQQSNFLMSHMREMYSRVVAERDSLKADKDNYKKETISKIKYLCEKAVDELEPRKRSSYYREGFFAAIRDVELALARALADV